MNCYGSRIAGLPILSRGVLMVLEEARGIYRTRGMTAREIAQRLTRMMVSITMAGCSLPPCAGYRHVAQHHVITARQVAPALTKLRNDGLARNVVAPGNGRALHWRPR